MDRPRLTGRLADVEWDGDLPSRGSKPSDVERVDA